jgi:hypothetical protein
MGYKGQKTYLQEEQSHLQNSSTIFVTLYCEVYEDNASMKETKLVK